MDFIRLHDNIESMGTQIVDTIDRLGKYFYRLNKHITVVVDTFGCDCFGQSTYDTKVSIYYDEDLIVDIYDLCGKIDFEYRTKDIELLVNTMETTLKELKQR